MSTTTSPRPWSWFEAALCATVVAAAAGLRFSGLHNGIPFALGVDEPEVAERALHILRSGDFHPHFFDYPSLYIYLEAVVDAVRFLVGASHGLWTNLDQVHVSAFYAWNRAVTAAFGSATVWLTYLVARRLSTTAAVSAAVVMAFMAPHVRESHWVLTDVPMTFFVTLTLLLTVVAVERGTAWTYFRAGAAAGLAAATKYNGGLFVLLPIAALAFTRRRDAPLGLGAGLTTIVAGAAAAFLVCAPYTVLALPEFLNSFAYLNSIYSAGAWPPEAPWLTYLKHLRNALFWPGAVTAIISIGLASVRTVAGPPGRRAVWALSLAAVVLHFQLISDHRLVYGRYLLPLMPPLAVMMGGTIAWSTAWLVRRLAWAARPALVATALTAVVAAAPAVTSLRFVAGLEKVSTHELAYDWFQQHVPPGTKIVIETRGLLLPADRYATINVPRLIEYDFDHYAAESDEYLVASSQSFGPFVYGNPSAERRAYLALFSRLQLSMTIMPSDSHPGPEYRIYRITR